MENQLTKKDWLDYLNRLQDRERQKIGSSGLSNWSLFVALAGLGYWIYPDIVNMQKNWLTMLFGYTFFYNLSLTIFDVFNKYYRQEKVINFRLPVSIIDKKGSLPLKIQELIMIFVGFIINGYFIYYSYQNGFYLFVLYFVLYFMRHLTQICSSLIFFLFKDWLQKNSLKIEEESFGKEKNKIISKLIQFLFGILLKVIMTSIIFLFVCNYYDFNDILWKQVFDGLALVIIVILSQFLLVIFMKRMKIAWLEQLEKEIIINDLNHDQIVFKLTSGYFNLSNIDNYF